MPYVEFPADRIVNVHWHKKDNGGGPDDELPCGAFQHGYALWDDSVPEINYGNIPGQGLFILDAYNIYGIGFDTTSGHDPLKPRSYWWTTADYLRPGPIDSRDVPFVWGTPRSWTLTVNFAELAYRLDRLHPGFVLNSVVIQEWRNINIQTWPTGLDLDVPDRQIEGTTMEIAVQREDEAYPPGFRVLQITNFDFGPRLAGYPPMMVQAHCTNETTGAYPPPPPGIQGNPFHVYPAPGQTNWPPRPPPPPPYT